MWRRGWCLSCMPASRIAAARSTSSAAPGVLPLEPCLGFSLSVESRLAAVGFHTEAHRNQSQLSRLLVRFPQPLVCQGITEQPAQCGHLVWEAEVFRRDEFRILEANLAHLDARRFGDGKER